MRQQLVTSDASLVNCSHNCRLVYRIGWHGNPRWYAGPLLIHGLLSGVTSTLFFIKEEDNSLYYGLGMDFYQIVSFQSVRENTIQTRLRGMTNSCFSVSGSFFVIWWAKWQNPATQMHWLWIHLGGLPSGQYDLVAHMLPFTNTSGFSDLSSTIITVTSMGTILAQPYSL